MDQLFDTLVCTAHDSLRHRHLGTFASPIEALAAKAMEATGRYRVLYRVPPSIVVPPALCRGADLGIGVALDTETTGVDVASCEIIEVAVTRFEFCRADGRILRVTGAYSGLEQPSRPIPPEVVRLTGIVDADVAGRRIDDDAVRDLIAGVDLVLAHNAGFDRPVVERRWPEFAAMAWGCSYKQVPWQEEGGYEGGKLGHLTMQAGAYHDGHRASDDVDALLHLLGLPLPVSGRTALAALLEQAQRDTVRIWADGAPFHKKDLLKERGYRWSDGTRGTPKSWHREVDEADLEAEVDFLRRCVMGDPRIRFPTRLITAATRFSPRADRPA